MAAISTPKINWLPERLAADFPSLTFSEAIDFYWSPATNTIYYPPLRTEEDAYQLLHEVGHAQLGHNRYPSDITLLVMERQAWQYAVDHLATRYGLGLDMNSPVVELSLDSYRDWLHARSTCPHCQAVGIEKPGHYLCLVCQKTWRVNEARSCQLRRYKNSPS